MSQTPSSAEATYPTGRFDIGPGGIITDSPANRELLELIENTPPLLPVELHELAVSYQMVDSGLGNRLAFIALDNIFQNPIVQQALSVSSPPLVTNRENPANGVWCAIQCLTGKAPGCPCQIFERTHAVKRVLVAGLDLLVEVTQIDETKTFAILGVSPSVLPAPVQKPDGDTSSAGSAEPPQNP